MFLNLQEIAVNLFLAERKEKATDYIKKDNLGKYSQASAYGQSSLLPVAESKGKSAPVRESGSEQPPPAWVQSSKVIIND